LLITGTIGPPWPMTSVSWVAAPISATKLDGSRQSGDR
jgi:hypothetical protein